MRIYLVSVLALLVALSTNLDIPSRISKLPEPEPRAAVSTTEADLERDIPRLMKDANVPGLQIGLIDHFQVVWTKGFGVRSAETQTPVDSETVFGGASLGKAIFAYAVMKLVDEGRLGLDVPLAHYVGHAEIADPRADAITTRMVLSHRTGFPNWRLHKPLQIYFTPGERFSYSGEGFLYLQHVVEHITGQSIPEFMSDKVFLPLGMHRSSYVWEARFDDDAAMPHDGSGLATKKSKPAAANVAGSLNTTAGDYARFVVAVLQGTGLANQSWREMLKRQGWVDSTCVECVQKPVGPLSTSVGWGLSWGLEEKDDDKIIWHWGDNGNFKAFVMADTNKGSGVVYFANSSNGLALAQKLVVETLGGDHPAFKWVHLDQ